MGLTFSGRRALAAMALCSGGAALAPATSPASVPPPNTCWWTTGQLNWTHTGLADKPLWASAVAANAWSSAKDSKIKLTFLTQAQAATTFANIQVSVLNLQGWPYYTPEGVNGFTYYGQNPVTGQGGNCDANHHYTRQVQVVLDTEFVASSDMHMVQTVMSHEFGHAIGLGHTTDRDRTVGTCPNGMPWPQSIMYGDVSPSSTLGSPCGPDTPLSTDLTAANALYTSACSIPCSC